MTGYVSLRSRKNGHVKSHRRCFGSGAMAFRAACSRITNKKARSLCGSRSDGVNGLGSLFYVLLWMCIYYERDSKRREAENTIFMPRRRFG